MKITSYEVMENLNSAISDYNQKFYGEENEKQNIIPLIEDDGEISEENLEKIKNLRITIRPERLTEEELNDFNSEIKKLLDKTNLQILSVNVIARKSPLEFNVDFLNNLNEDVENLQLIGVDLSNKGPELFDKFNNLKILALDKCNISNPEIISNLNENVRVSIKQNTIDPQYYKNIINLLEKHHGKIEATDKDLKIIANAFRWKRIDIQSFLNNRNIVDFDRIQGLTITIDESFNQNNEELEKTVDILNNMPNAKTEAPIADFERIKSVKGVTLPTRIIIKNAAELSTKQIEDNSNIESVAIQDENNSKMRQAEPYTREEFLAVRKRIDEITASVEVPEQSVPGREKKIFAQVYKKLAEQIVYDHYAISKEGVEDEKLQTTSRNLYGGLVQGKAVCAGYADILRNVLACFEIDARFIGENVSLEPGHRFYKDEGGHAWNMVTLDGKSYLTDLTWDRNNIVANRYPLEFCLKSKQDFKHDKYSTFNSGFAEKCTESLSLEEQAELFTGSREYDMSPKREKVAYLSSMVMDCAEAGMTEGQIRGAHSGLTKEIKNIKEVGERGE